jgi:type I restriction enzyme S subunit
LIRGTTYKGDLVGQPGPVLLGLASIQPDGGFRRGSFKTYGGESPRKITLGPGDIYVSLKDVTQSGDLLGSVARVPRDIAAGRLTQDTVKLEFSGKPLDRDYLYWLLRTPIYRAYCRAHATGTTTLGLARDDFLDFPVAEPGDEELSLVELLEGLDDRIDLLRETNATLEAIAQALFKTWFVDFDPVRAKHQGLAPAGLDEATAALFPDSFEESALGSVPKGWRAGSLADLADLNPESWSARNHPERIAYVDLANAKNNEIAAVTEFVFDEAPSRARRALRSGDTIVGTVRPGNRSFAFIHEPASSLTASTGFAVLRPKWRDNTAFIYLAATQESSIEHLAHVADGGAYPAVRPEAVSALACVLPPGPILRSFNAVACPLLEAVAAKQSRARTLATLRDTLLPRLISGQLRLPEAEALAEEAA